MRRIVTVLAILGLIVAQFMLSHDHVQASSRLIGNLSGQTLSGDEMLVTKGTSICDDYECDNGDGCVTFNSAYIHWEPKTLCDDKWYGTCNNFVNGICWHKDYYANNSCRWGAISGDDVSKVDFCSTK